MLIKLYIDNKIIFEVTVDEKPKVETKFDIKRAWRNLRHARKILNKTGKLPWNDKVPTTATEVALTKQAKRKIEAATKTLDKTTTPVAIHKGLLKSKLLFACPYSYCSATFDNERSLRTHLGWHKRWKPEYKNVVQNGKLGRASKGSK